MNPHPHNLRVAPFDLVHEAESELDRTCPFELGAKPHTSTFMFPLYSSCAVSH